MIKLTEEQIEGGLAGLVGWQREDEKWILRKYRFRNYLNGIAYVNRVAQIAEQLNHHPFISIDYKMVTLRLTTWHAGGLTELDFTAAAEFDKVFSEME